jgi:hypothetical protein
MLGRGTIFFAAAEYEDRTMKNIFSMHAVRTTLMAAALVMAPAAAFAGVIISVGFAPPALPVYVQPIAPGDGYLWNPGYWAYTADSGYYWVPGVWVRPPQVGLLWTPGYWGWGGGGYLFHAGYWGPHVGFYGGVNYGFGYGGTGFWGGRWEGGHFAYNTAVMHVDRTVIRNTYVDNVHVTNVGVRTSFNGGSGGIQARPNQQEQQWSHENRVAATSEQQQHRTMAHADRSNFASANGGRPQNAAVSRAGERANNQQQRIGQGVRSGQMTAGGTRNVEGREASIHRETANDRAANGGRLTGQERQQVNQRQNNVSRSINQDKHNAAQQPRAEQPRAEQPRAEQQRGGGAHEGGGGGGHEGRK